jgi:hypothetical protein
MYPTSSRDEKGTDMIRKSARRSLLGAATLFVSSAFPGLAQAQGVSFAPPRDFVVGNVPQWVAVGDFNGDGVQDLVTANYDSNDVSVLLGNGDGTFLAPLNLSVGPSSTPNCVAIGDFNGDGRADLAVATFGGGSATSIAVLLGNGNGTFLAPQTVNTGRGPLWVAVGDLNGDGLQDLAVANFNSDAASVSVLLGNGNGTFQAARNTPVHGAACVAVGDFNRDGLQDLAVVDYYSGNVAVLLGNGDGTYAPAVIYAAEFNALTVTVGDLSGDGLADLAVANWNQNQGNTVSVLVGNGDGTFQPKQNVVVGRGVAAAVMGDFNDDAATDLVVPSFNGNFVSVLLNTTTQAPPDTTPPAISGVSASGITSSGATISWTTNENSDSQVEYGTTTAYGSSTALNASLVTAHSQTLGALSASTLYHYRVRSRDGAGNLAVSGDFTFTTQAAADATPPTISGVSASGITSSSATISWTTNEASDSQVEYGTTTAYGSSTALNSSRVTSHSQALNGLSAGALYHYRVKSRDAAGNLAVSGDNTFTTTVQTFTLTVTIENLVSLLGIGSGSVTSSPAGIDCGSTCSATYNSGTAVTLTAHPGLGSFFVGWSGGGCSGTGTCTVPMGANKSVTAQFKLLGIL